MPNLHHCVLAYSDLFLKAVYATTESKYVDALAAFPSDLVEYLKDVSEENVYLLKMKGITNGRTTNQISEVGQQLIMPMRRLPITTGLFLFHQKDSERMLNVQRINPIKNQCID
jgi:hypothetical protein